MEKTVHSFSRSLGCSILPKQKAASCAQVLVEYKKMDKSKYEILLIEDDVLDQKAFLRMVKEKHLLYNCTIAGSVSEARGILTSASDKFDIIIADYLLGDGTAFDILDLTSGTPTIFVTGSGDEEVAIKAWKAGACDYLIKDPEQNYLRAISVTVENAIKHWKNEQKLQLLSLAIASIEDSVYITDMENKIIFVNRVFCETYGYSEEEVVGKDCDLLRNGNLHSNDTEDKFQDVPGWETGFYDKRKDGSKFPVSIHRSCIRDEKGDVVALLGVIRDISEFVHAEGELRVINQELKKTLH